MLSDRKIAANRRNARRSTGPRTAATKARASRNALRHGLAIPLSRDPLTSAEIDRLAAALAGRSPTPARLEQAHIAAEAEFELLRVQAHRKSLLHRKAVALATNREAIALVAALPELEALERYERRAVSRRKRAMRWLTYTAITTTG